MPKVDQGYYREPSIHGDSIVFVSDDDLWSTNTEETSNAVRLTSNVGRVSSPRFSPDGKYIAYAGTEEGNMEVYIIPSEGGVPKRVTYTGSTALRIVCWNKSKIIFAGIQNSPSGNFNLYSVDKKGGIPTDLNFGIASDLSFGKSGCVIRRRTPSDPARWKRYKGGTAGEIWIDLSSKNKFKKLVNLNGNFASPMWISNRIYFIGDHLGIAYIFSCKQNGRDIQQHTFFKDYYIRNASTDGTSIVFHAGADIYTYNLKDNRTQLVSFKFTSPRTQTNRKFISVSKYLEDFDLNHDATKTVVNSRGKSFLLSNWSGTAKQLGKNLDARYRLSRFLKNEKVVVVSDSSGNDQVEVYDAKNQKLSFQFSFKDLGRPIKLYPSPEGNNFCIVNHKHEILLGEIKKKKIKKIDQSKSWFVDGLDWSPDERYVAYSCSISNEVSVIKVYDLSSNKSRQITDAVMRDSSPSFDASGKFLAFISNRVFNPVYDTVQFDLGFPKSFKPYVVSLSKSSSSPFIPREDEKNKDTEKNKKSKKVKVAIDFKNIQNRIQAVPVSEGIYGKISFSGNKIFYNSYQITGTFDSDLDASNSTLKYYDLETLEEKIFCSGVTDFKATSDQKHIAVRFTNKIRVLSNQAPPSKEILSDLKPIKKTGLIDLNKINLEIKPTNEWKQMYGEAWRLQRDYFWTKDMSKVDWNKVYRRYFKLIDRVSTRAEFSDLMWEMQGELGTSHAYELGGDYSYPPQYQVGLLGAEFEFMQSKSGYRISKILRGDVWRSDRQSPLLRPGLNIKEGDVITEIEGKKLTKSFHPNMALINRSNCEVEIEVKDVRGRNKRKLQVKTVGSEFHLRYRDWVESNRDYVHRASKNKVGYVHIPDMGGFGYSEFHRYFLVEKQYDGLVIDVRFNGGGHVSSLILQKLAKKVLGYGISRNMGTDTYPEEAPKGPMVAITNEFAGSDGDIFSHSFKMLKLGKLIGKRTWGGVIGIWPRNSLVDGTMTTQPEFSFWFKDVGWNVENYGTDVDVEVDILPDDVAGGKDPQLDKAIEIVMKELKESPVFKPTFPNKPNLKLP